MLNVPCCGRGGLRCFQGALPCTAGWSALNSQSGVLKQDANLYNTLPEPTDDENDMLDLAYGLTETCALPNTLLSNQGSTSLYVTEPAPQAPLDVLRLALQVMAAHGALPWIE